MSCPFSVAITPELATRALSDLFKSSSIHEKWNDRQLICAYICLHWALSSDLPQVLAHRPYLDILPGEAQLRTPLYFTPDEMEAFKGTNLYGIAVDSRRAEWQAECEQCQRDIEAHDETTGKGITWASYLRAATYLSSRAFPSTILSATPSLQHSATSHQVLLPGIDSLNHARGTPVSWIITNHTPTNTPAKLAVNLVLHSAAAPGDELFNNYGPKPNAELILGYGFALKENPSDTIVLQIGGAGDRRRFEVGRGASGAEEVWDEVLALVTAHASGESGTYEDALEAAGMLGDMLLALQDRLPDVDAFKGSDKIRGDVKEMLEYYVEGQRDILRALLEFAQAKEQASIEDARAQGVDLVFEEQGIEEEDEDEDEEQYEDAEDSEDV
ncbi:hypothetical protein HWV62_38184 [Athelia sp. TMB]|nr:hypothetical protein HWV62_38184 [Athelia sp. TMB]